jgi:Aerobic-type carbon monoxide dehydrogenase, middle subunit CoxM/CutM homologs
MVISVTSLAMVTDIDKEYIGIALGSVSALPCRSKEAEYFISENIDWNNMTVQSGAIENFERLIRESANPIDDHRSSSVFRTHTIGVLGRRALFRIFRLEN